MANELREYEIELRKEGETKARKKIARKMKDRKSTRLNSSHIL